MSTSTAGTFPLRGDLPPHLVEVETFSTPGTSDVTAGDRKKLAGLLKHYRGQAHPFTACKRDQMKHGLSEDHANRRCAVLKDLIKGTTKWRKGGGDKATEEAIEILGEAMTVLELALAGIGPRSVAALLHEEKLEESEDAPWLEEVQIAAALMEAAPRWMIPVAARRKGFRPVQRGSGRFDESKHRRAPKGSPGGGRFIQMGSSGAEVAAIQRRVGAAETGTFNAQTKRLVEALQKRKGIKVDGIVGTQTANAMHGNTSVAPGRLTKNDRRFFRRYGRRTSSSSTSPPPADRRRRQPIPAPSEDSLPERKTARLASQGWDYHDGMWFPPGHPKNRKGSSSRRIVRTRRSVVRA